MGDRSPGRNAKKAGKTIKEKRAERRARTDGQNKVEQVTSRRKG